MIEIRSYIKDGDQLIPIESYAGPLRDDVYIEGVLELSIHGKPLLTKAMWDLVDQLWIYLIDAVITVVGGGEASFSFPDQPLPVALRPAWRGRGIEIQVEQQRATAERGEFLQAFCAAGTLFMERMGELLPTNDAGYHEALARLAVLRAQQSGSR